MARLSAAAVALVVLSATASGQKPTFSSESQVVVLHVAVRDRHGYVSGLEQSAFHVFENQKAQPVTFFSNQDAPVTVGLIIDSSGSMGPNRSRVIAAAAGFAANSNPNDDIFALAFNEHVTPSMPGDHPFTSDPEKLRVALETSISARGQTAIYDAIDAGLKDVDKGRYERKVLVLVSDGGDNASRITKDQILTRAQSSNVVIYTMGLIDPMETHADPKFLKVLSRASGGESFEPPDVAETDRVLQHIAHDIRNLYTVGYVPASVGGHQELRTVTVQVTLPKGGRAIVRTRHAYLAGRREGSEDASQP